MTENTNTDTEALVEPLAIIGMSGHFPGAKSCEEFWQNLSNGVESIEFFSDEVALANGADPELIGNPHFVKAHGVLADVEYFDAGFFNMSPREARILDPQHRVFLEAAWEAMENAGYDAEKYDGQVGVYAGTAFSTYLLRNILPNNLVRFQTIDRLEMALTNHKDTMPMRVSFHMNLTGPSICVGTTCSTSLVAVHLACQALWSYQADMVLAGASFIRTPAREGYLFQEGMIYSPDGHLRTFDADSKGIVTGAGVGVVVIKRLADAIADGDTVQAVIKATALNNDGSTKIGYTAPSIGGQAKVMAEAMELAGIHSDSVSYIETHGTGTELGDPVEVAAMTQAFHATAVNPETQKKQYCAIGSAKPNIGHLNHAAAIAGLIKAILALKHKQLPPSLNFKKPNPKIDFENSPFYVNTKLQDWNTNGAPRRAGVNAFGIGGTNGHVVLEEAPIAEPTSNARPHQVLMLTAKTLTALDKITSNLAQHLSDHPDVNLADVAFTLHMGRKAFDYRRIVIADTVAEAIERLREKTPQFVFDHYQKASTRPVVFMFSGQGSQYVNMAKEVYQTEAVFKQHLDYCANYLKPLLNVDLRDLLYPTTLSVEEATAQLQQTAITQAALFSVEYALAQLWMAWGVKPKAMIGHSIGEYVAACIAGVFSLDDALSLVAARGQLMQSVDKGNMLAVSLPAEQLQTLLPENLSLALINSSSLCVVSGTNEAITSFAEQMKAREVQCQILHTSHAFHSHMMAAIVEPFTARMRQTSLNPPTMPYVSNVTGDWITAEQATNPDYWAQHLRQTVQFAKGLENLFLDHQQVLLEVGPGRTLSSLARQHQAKKAEQWVLTSLPHPQETQPDAGFLLTSLGRLWLAGTVINHKAFYAGRKLHRIELPTYPFERQRYWIDAPKPGQSNVTLPQGSLSRLSNLDQDAIVENPLTFAEQTLVAPRNAKEQKLADIWKEALGASFIGIHDNFFDLGGSSLLASVVVARIFECLRAELSISEFLNAPTIAELALIVKVDVPESKDVATSDTTTDNTAQCLVKIKSGDESRPMLFLVHPIDGYASFYRELAQDLPEQQAVYAFQANGLDDNSQVLTSVEQMATAYIAAMRSKQARGPYLLGGASFGGLVAFEMAQQLKQANEEVKLLFMVDTPAPGQNLFKSEKDSEVLAFIACYLLKMGDEAPKAAQLETLPTEQQLATILEQAKALGCLPASFEMAQLQNWLTVFKTNSQAMTAYVPQTYAGHLTFFRAQQPWNKENPGHPEYFWLEKALQGIDIYTVSGTHISMNLQPQVSEIAQKLARYF
jgi:acyl transferase domain-containing protein/thioesterase domain-containing protein